MLLWAGLSQPMTISPKGVLECHDLQKFARDDNDPASSFLGPSLLSNVLFVRLRGRTSHFTGAAGGVAFGPKFGLTGTSDYSIKFGVRDVLIWLEVIHEK